MHRSGESLKDVLILGIFPQPPQQTGVACASTLTNPPAAAGQGITLPELLGYRYQATPFSPLQPSPPPCLLHPPPLDVCLTTVLKSSSPRHLFPRLALIFPPRFPRGFAGMSVHCITVHHTAHSCPTGPAGSCHKSTLCAHGGVYALVSPVDSAKAQ